MALISVTMAQQEAKDAALDNPFYGADLAEAKIRGTDTMLDNSQKRHVQFRPLLSLALDVRARKQGRPIGLQAQDDLTYYYYLLQLRQVRVREHFTATDLHSILRIIEPYEWEPRTIGIIPRMVYAEDKRLGNALADLCSEDLNAIRDMHVLLKDADAQLRYWSANEVETFFNERDRQRHALLVQEHNELIEGGGDLRKGVRKTVVKQI